MTVVYFFYGLAFFTLGVALLVRDVPEGILELRAGLRWLALFALIHSANEWLVMAKLSGLIEADIYTDGAVAVLNGTSFAALLAAGLFLAGSHGGWDARAAKSVVIVATAIWLAVSFGTFAGDWRFAPGEIAARWLLGAPGAFLAAIGLVVRSRILVRAGREKSACGPALAISLRPLRLGFLVAAACLVAYGLLTLPGPKASFSPANVLNAGAFEQAFGFPIQIPRTLAAVLMAAAMVLSLRQFHKIERADLEHQVRNRTDQLVENQDKLRQAIVEADRANQSKSEFLANMSHELRTPLNAIIGFSDVMRNEMFGPAGNPKYTEYVTDINSSGLHLLALINDILDLSKIEAGKTELREEHVDVSRTVGSCLTLVKERATEANIEIECDTMSNLPELYVDERKFKQILINLLSNAIKFTPSGGKVAVRIWLRRDDGFVLQVADTGIGIALADIPKALSPFQQIDGDLNRKYDGTGLGLPLTKALVDLHGGSLDLQSEVDIGTTVTVRFPAERIRSEPISVPAVEHGEASAAE